VGDNLSSVGIPPVGRKMTCKCNIQETIINQFTKKGRSEDIKSHSPNAEDVLSHRDALKYSGAIL